MMAEQDVDRRCGRAVVGLLAGLIVSFGCLAPALGAVSTYHDLSAFLADAGTLQIEPFDSAPWVPPYTPLPDPVINLGLRWRSAFDESLQVVDDVSVSPLQSVTSADSGKMDVTDEVRAFYPNGWMSAVGAWVANDGDGNDVVMTARQMTGAPIGSVTAPLASLAPGEFRFIGLIVDSPIPWEDYIVLVEFRPVGGTDDDFFLDDFYFNQIPEPTTLSLLGLGALAIRRRRRR